MSLLLDALKKAADDKEKNKKGSSNGDEPKKDDTHASDDLDLELELDDFPKVDKDLTKQQKTDNPIEASNQDALLIEDKIIVSQSVDPQKQELKPEDSISDNDSLNLMDREIPETSKVIDHRKQPGPELKINESDSERRRPSAAKLDSTIQMDAAALDALINKSNNQSKNSKMKRTVLYIISIAILLTGTGLYFVLQVTQSTESIYTAGSTTQQQADYIQRKSEEEITETVSAPAVEESVPPSTAQAIKAKPKQPKAIKTTKSNIPQEKKVTIIHRKVEDPTDVLLRRAYQAFNDADYVTSRQLYETVLEKEKNNKDAMLGVAAVAVKEQRLEYAKQKYLQLLYLDPKDSYAKAGLTAVESQQNTTLNESQLKMMLREQSDVPHLHFALGSLYASQEKWPDAQAEFFSAWSSDNQNPDYAFNLAVSLDHMDKTRQAIELYELSVKLLDAGNGNFSKDDVQNRIMVLKNAANKDAN
ncbi:MAG TPA: hypothetical protein VIQ03_03995 [Gammaproteobacteria bacterium]